MRLLDQFESKYAKLWRETGVATPTLGQTVTPQRRRENAGEAERLLTDLTDETENLPEAEPARTVWREGWKNEVRKFGEERLGWPGGYRDLVFADEFFDASVRFSREARGFDDRIRGEDVGQALRNVWIVNSLQMLLGLRVGMSDAVFGYSMLYP